MVVRFVDHWKERTGHYPARVLFDSRATTYEQLHELQDAARWASSRFAVVVRPC